MAHVTITQEADNPVVACDYGLPEEDGVKRQTRILLKAGKNGLAENVAKLVRACKDLDIISGVLGSFKRQIVAVTQWRFSDARARHAFDGVLNDGGDASPAVISIYEDGAHTQKYFLNGELCPPRNGEAMVTIYDAQGHALFKNDDESGALSSEPVFSADCLNAFACVAGPVTRIHEFDENYRLASGGIEQRAAAQNRPIAYMDMIRKRFERHDDDIVTFTAYSQAEIDKFNATPARSLLFPASFPRP